MAGEEFQDILVVADDDQIIYQWNGASHRRLEAFRRDFEPMLMQLPTNFRCPPQIVYLANHLIEHNFLRSPEKQPLVAARPVDRLDDDVIRVPSFDTVESEAAGIAQDIACRHGNNLASVVVLARNRKLLDAAKDGLDSRGLASVIAQRRDSFASSPFIWLHAGLRQSNDRRDRRNLEILAGSFGKLTGVEVDLQSVIASAGTKHGDYLREWCDTVLALGVCKVRNLSIDLRQFAGQITDSPPVCGWAPAG